MKKRILFVVPAAFLFCAALIAVWLYVPQGIDDARASLAEYDLQKLTCGSCVTNIEKALDGLEGVGSVQIDLTRSRGRISFDAETTSADEIARTISAAGYPAALRSQLDPAELAALRDEEARLSETYVARISDRLVTRSEFESRVDEVVGAGQASDPAALSAARLKVWNDLLQRELLLNAASRSGVVVQDGEVDARLAEIEHRHPGFEDRVIAEFGSPEKFRERLREDLIIQRTLEDHVLDGSSDPARRMSLIQSWYAGLSQSAEVEIYDPQLQALTTAKTGGCGGSCCG